MHPVNGSVSSKRIGVLVEHRKIVEVLAVVGIKHLQNEPGGCVHKRLDVDAHEPRSRRRLALMSMLVRSA